jgi:hypothetical protein
MAAMKTGDRIREHDHPAARLACGSFDGMLDLGSVAWPNRARLHAEGRCSRFYGVPHPDLRRLHRIVHDSNTLYGGRDFLQHFDHFSAN